MNQNTKCPDKDLRIKISAADDTSTLNQSLKNVYSRTGTLNHEWEIELKLTQNWGVGGKKTKKISTNEHLYI